MLLQACCIILYPLVNSNLSYSPDTTNLGQIRRFLEPWDLEIWRMTLKNNRAPLLCYFKLLSSISYPLMNSNWSYSPETSNLGQILRFLEPCDLEIWRMTLQCNRAPLLCYFKLCASFHSHWWIQTGVTGRERPIWVKFNDFSSHVTLKFDGWPWKTNRAPLLSNIKLYASFHRNMWIQTGVTIRKQLNGVMTSVTLTFDLWPWPFAWT